MTTKKLGIDVGTTSAAIVLVEENQEEQKINILERELIIFPFKNPKESAKYDNGSSNFQTDNSKKTQYRGSRRGRVAKKRVYKKLEDYLGKEFGWKKDNNNFDVHKLKVDGQNRILSTEELCAVIFNYTKFRGFNFEVEEENSEYKKEANNLIEWCNNNDKTVTHFFYDNNIPFHKSRTITVGEKEKVFNPPPIHESLHIDELVKILNKQKEAYNQFSTQNKVDKLLNLMYFKKPLPSQKHLLSKCEFERNKRVVSSSNPFFQKLRIIQRLRDVRITVGNENGIKLTEEEVSKLYEKLLDTREFLTDNAMLKIIGRGEEINFKKIKGSNTIASIKSFIPEITDEELYEVWHKIYSHKNPNVIVSSLVKFGIDEDVAISLSLLNLERTDYCAYSEKAIKKLLPYMDGSIASYDLYEAKNIVYGNYLSNEKEKKQDRLSNIEKNKLRNPVVEKSWNQITSVINRIIDAHGDIDEVRVEMARELKLPKKTREKISKMIRQNESNRNFIKSALSKLGVKITRNNIKRVTLWLEQGGNIDKNTLRPTSDAIDIYTGKKISLNQALNQSVINIEHTLCKSRFFDDSMKYITITFDEFNKRVKKNRTAFEVVSEDFSEQEKKDFENRVKQVYKGNLSKQRTFKYGYENFPDSIPSNQKTLTSYIAKKFVEKLSEVFDNVFVTNGKITSWIRHETGIQQAFEEFVEKSHPEALEDKANAGKGKRIDHRHHIVDAFVIAITNQSYIQKLNRLNSYYIDNKDKETRYVNNVQKSILKNIEGRFGDDSVVDVVINLVKSTIVKIKKPNHIVFHKGGAMGVRGSIHQETPIKQTEVVDVLVGGKLNKAITNESIYSKHVKSIISQYDTPEQAFSDNHYLSELKKLKVYVSTDGRVIVNNNVFKSGNNHRIDIFKSGDRFSSKTVSAYEYISGYQPEQEPLLILHKKDYVVIGLSSKQVDDAITSGNFEIISQHLFYVAKIDGSGIIHFQRHYFNSNTIKKLKGSYNSLIKKYGENRIVKMKILNDGIITRYQKINSKKTLKI